MLQLERQNLILSYLEKNRKATTNELSDMLGVSATTIRTDLNQMDKEHLLTKTHGGALYLDHDEGRKDLTSKAYLFAKEAAKLVQDHMCIFLDASSTSYTLGLHLTGFTELTVITNGIDLALAMKDIPGVTVIMTGGIVTSASSSIEGLLGADLLKKLHTDIAFVSARGFSMENGLTDFSIYEADLKRLCVSSSSRTVALIDHTKFDTNSISSYASIDDINLLITDSGLSKRLRESYEKAGVNLLVAENF